MAVMNRVEVVWSGFVGGPGMSVFYLDNGSNVATFLTAVKAFFDALATRLPNDVTISYPGSGDGINDTDGALVSSWTATPPAPTVGTGAGSYSAPSGAWVAWQTAGIVRGRRVQGRTFIVPLHGQEYDTDGSLVASFVAALNTAAATLVGLNPPQGILVWSRPVRDAQGNITAVGSSHLMTGSRVRDKVATLRSRRD